MAPIETKEAADWTLNEKAPSFDEFELGMIPIDELRDDLRVEAINKTVAEENRFDYTRKPVHKDHTEAMKLWEEQQKYKGSFKRAMVVSIIMLAIIITMISFMVSTADAGMAFMRFTVFEITEETVIVVDEHEDFFTFYKEDDFPEMKKGDEVMVCTDLTYNGRDKWEWDRGRTSIIEVKP